MLCIMKNLKNNSIEGIAETYLDLMCQVMINRDFLVFIILVVLLHFWFNKTK